MTDGMEGELTRLRLSVDALGQGLRLMVETQETHTEMLRAILDAASAEAPKSELPGLLREIVARLDEQTELLHRLEAAGALARGGGAPARAEASGAAGAR